MMGKILSFFKRNASKSLNKILEGTQNPYIAARLEWNYLFGDLMKAKRNWRWAALIALIANILLIGGVLKMSSESHLIPYIVKVDALGNSLYGGCVDEKNNITPLEINAFIRQFIINAKSVSIDPFAQKRNTELVYGASLPPVRTILDNYYRTQNPFQISKQELIEVQIKGVIQKSKRTWQIDWVEIHRNHDGVVMCQKNWEALLTICHHQVNNAEILNTNPLGIFIEQMSWAEQV